MKAATRRRRSSARALIWNSIGASSGRQERARLGEPGEVVVGVAEGSVDHRDALEQVADLVLHRDADAAMELDRLLADEAARAPDLHLGARHGAAALPG